MSPIESTFLLKEKFEARKRLEQFLKEERIKEELKKLFDKEKATHKG